MNANPEAQPTHRLTLADGAAHLVQVSDCHDEFWTDEPINDLSELLEGDPDDPDADRFWYTPIADLFVQQGTMRLEKL